MSCEDKQVALTSKLMTLMESLKAKMETVAAEAQEEAKGIDPDINTDGPDVWIGANIDIKWERTDFSLDLPEITMKDQKWSFDLPKVDMKNRDIIFHTPSIRMERRKTGEYPEFYCDSGFIPKCTVRMSPIYMDVPVPFDEEQRIVLSVPEFSTQRVEFVWSLPEFKMVTSTFAIHLPQVTVKNISAEASKAKEAGEQLSEKTKNKTAAIKESFKEQAKMEHGWEVAALFECYQMEILKQRDEGMANFNSGISMVQAALTSMAASKVPSDNENYTRMVSQLGAMVKSRDEFAVAMIANFESMDTAQKGFIESMFK